MYFIKKSTKRFLEYYRNINFLIVLFLVFPLMKFFKLDITNTKTTKYINM